MAALEEQSTASDQEEMERARALVKSIYEVEPGRQPDRLATWGDRLVLLIARHWLALFNLAVFIYLSLPFLAPVLMEAGLEQPARLIYLTYRPACHQLPERSYFLFGRKAIYSLQELEAAGVLKSTFILDRRRFIGNEALGWKVAICERDVAIYGSVVLAGLLFGLARGWLPRLSFKLYLLFLVPIGVDGLTQLIGLRSSNWWLRTVTGAVFGLGTVWFAYPYLAEAMDEVRRGTEYRLAQRRRVQEVLAETGQNGGPTL